MKTKVFLSTLLLMLLSTTIKAQYLSTIFESIDKFEVLDTAHYVITYDYKVIIDTVRKEKRSDQLRLEVGNNISKIYSLSAYKNDSLSTDLMNKGIDDNFVFSRGIPEIIYKNYPSNKTTVINRTITHLFKYEEIFPLIFQWKLLPEKKKVLDYNCQKAESTFRGRTYTAWFTPEIPLKEGPYKFGGLPGLILELSDSQNYFNYTCVGIEKPKIATPIVYWTWKCNDITREKFLDLSKKMHKTPLTYQRTAKTGGMNFVSPDGNVTPAPDRPSPYNPIERE